MEHRTVSRPTAAKMMPLDQPCKATALAGCDDMNQFVRVEDVDHDLVTRIRRFLSGHGNFAGEFGRRDIGFLEMARHRLIHALGFDEFDETKLNGIVAVFLFRLFLNNNTWSSLDDSDRHDGSVVL